MTMTTRDLMAPDTEPTDEELAAVMDAARELAVQRRSLSDAWVAARLEEAAHFARKHRSQHESLITEEFECVARDTKLGMEEITRDIPKVGEAALRNLDGAGIVCVGAEVGPGDILVGKITPTGQTQLSPKEKLLRVIFGEVTGYVRDTSLRLPPGGTGIVIDARVFARKGVEKDTRAQQIEDAELEKLNTDYRDNVSVVSDGYYNRIREILKDKVTAAKLVDDDGNVLIEAGAVVDDEMLAPIAKKHWGQLSLTTGEDTELVEALARRLEKDIDEIETIYREKIAKLTKDDELPPGVIKMVKVYVAIKRKMQVGDTMAGPHGNKGVISRILPTEDLRYLEDGTPVDIVLNPRGVPDKRLDPADAVPRLAQTAEEDDVLYDPEDELLAPSKPERQREKPREVS